MEGIRGLVQCIGDSATSDFLSISWNLFFTADLVAGYSASSVSPYCTVSSCIPEKKKKTWVALGVHPFYGDAKYEFVIIILSSLGFNLHFAP